MARRREGSRATPLVNEVLVPPELARSLIEDWFDLTDPADVRFLYGRSEVICGGRSVAGDLEYIATEATFCAYTRRQRAQNEWLRTTSEATGINEWDLRDQLSYGPPRFADRATFDASLRRAFADLGLERH